MQEKTNNETIRPRRRARRKRKLKKPAVLLALIILIIIIIVVVVIIKSKNKTVSSEEGSSEELVDEISLIGKWTTDENTIYEFYKDGKGALVVPISVIPFSYKTDEKMIYIDFEPEDSEDTNFEYILDDNNLTLKNSNGTFEFFRMDELGDYK